MVFVTVAYLFITLVRSQAPAEASIILFHLLYFTGARGVRFDPRHAGPRTTPAGGASGEYSHSLTSYWSYVRNMLSPYFQMVTRFSQMDSTFVSRASQINPFGAISEHIYSSDRIEITLRIFLYHSYNVKGTPQRASLNMKSCAAHIRSVPFLDTNSRTLSSGTNQMFSEWCHMFPEGCQMFPEWCQMFPEWFQMLRKHKS
jgi:hypothetical protein